MISLKVERNQPRPIFASTTLLRRSWSSEVIGSRGQGEYVGVPIVEAVGFNRANGRNEAICDPRNEFDMFDLFGNTYGQGAAGAVADSFIVGGCQFMTCRGTPRLLLPLRTGGFLGDEPPVDLGA